MKEERDLKLKDAQWVCSLDFIIVWSMSCICLLFREGLCFIFVYFQGYMVGNSFLLVLKIVSGVFFVVRIGREVCVQREVLLGDKEKSLVKAKNN